MPEGFGLHFKLFKIVNLNVYITVEPECFSGSCLSCFQKKFFKDFAFCRRDRLLFGNARNDLMLRRDNI